MEMETTVEAGGFSGREYLMQEGNRIVDQLMELPSAKTQTVMISELADESGRNAILESFEKSVSEHYKEADNEICFAIKRRTS